MTDSVFVLSIDSIPKPTPLKQRICQTAESQKQLLSFRKAIYVYLRAGTHTIGICSLKHYSGCHFSCRKIVNMLGVSEHYKSDFQLSVFFINLTLYYDYYLDTVK